MEGWAIEDRQSVRRELQRVKQHPKAKMVRSLRHWCVGEAEGVLTCAPLHAVERLVHLRAVLSGICQSGYYQCVRHELQLSLEPIGVTYVVALSKSRFQRVSLSSSRFSETDDPRMISSLSSRLALLPLMSVSSSARGALLQPTSDC